MSRSAIIAGGSIGGLFVANALRRTGWDVQVFERSDVELSGRGAGIVTHPALIDALRDLGADTSDLGVAVDRRVAFDRTGAEVAALDYPQIVTSWDRIHRILRSLLPKGTHHLGRHVAGYAQRGAGVVATLACGTAHEADLLVGADGFRSAVRGQMLPDIVPEYAGYVVWRALAQEADLPRAVHDAVFADFGLYLPEGGQVVGYPIAGPGNDLRAGHRRYNFVWYAPVPADALGDMLTDQTGTRHAVSIPPPLVRAEVLTAMERNARAHLPGPFVTLLEHSERPFFTPIYDHVSPVMADGAVALAGDAACVARPHVGMGVTKAAMDALALARHLDAAPVAEALAAYSAERVPASRAAWARSRRLGGYIFGTGADNADGRGNPRLRQIMVETASDDFSVAEELGTDRAAT